MTVAATMKAARMHEVGGPLVIEQIPTPEPSDMDVLVRVRSVGIVPNLGNILANWPTWYPNMPLPPLPAVFGLDPAGEVVKVGRMVHGLSVGDRVYINPFRVCGTCRHCARGDVLACRRAVFQGYFAFNPGASVTYKDYPHGGMCEYTTAPANACVRLPDNMDYDVAARLGYMGTAYSALKKAKVHAGDTVLINGISGTLGLGAAIFALAMGARRILGTGRNRELLAEVKALAPHRIEVHSLDDGSVLDFAHAWTDNEGVDGYVDCLGPGALPETFLQGLRALRRGGIAVDVGAVMGELPIDVHYMMDNNQTLVGSAWFATVEGQEMVDMVAANIVDLSIFETQHFTLEEANAAISGLAARHGGFSNFVVRP
jgi:threonine dehydrogenase-like Zn-dependent dehydrogenase